MGRGCLDCLGGARRALAGCVDHLACQITQQELDLGLLLRNSACKMVLRLLSELCASRMRAPRAPFVVIPNQNNPVPLWHTLMPWTE